jgi:hypothetical protein
MAVNFVIFELLPTGKCCLKSSYSKKNLERQRKGYKTKKRYRRDWQ